MTFATRAAAAFLACAVAPLGALAGDAQGGKGLFESKCSSCHGLAKATGTKRSPDGWRTIVGKMQDRAKGNPDKAFDDAAAARIAAYLAKAHGTEPAPEEEGAKRAGEEAASLPPAKVGPTKEAGEEDEGPGQPLGWAALVLIAAMIAAGFLRGKLGRRFLPVHRGGAILLVLGAAAHTAFMFLSSGPPRAGWHLLGSAAFVFVAAAAIIGLSRRRIGKPWLTIHWIIAVLSLTLAAAHLALH